MCPLSRVSVCFKSSTRVFFGTRESCFSSKCKLFQVVARREFELGNSHLLYEISNWRICACVISSCCTSRRAFAISNTRNGIALHHSNYILHAVSFYFSRRWLTSSTIVYSLMMITTKRVSPSAEVKPRIHMEFYILHSNKCHLLQASDKCIYPKMKSIASINICSAYIPNPSVFRWGILSSLFLCKRRFSLLTVTRLESQLFLRQSFLISCKEESAVSSRARNDDVSQIYATIVQIKMYRFSNYYQEFYHQLFGKNKRCLRKE